MAATPRECRARVGAVRALTPHILEADLEMDEPPELAFEAGQWISIPFGPKTVRAYSIASTPPSPRRITLCADVAPAGIGSAWFRGLAPGDVVRFKGPLGGFVYRRADARRPLFVAEEIGIVPVRSILSELYATGFGRPAALVYGARDAGWLVYDAEFRSLARRFPAFTYHRYTTDTGVESPGLPGALAGAVDGLVADVAGLVAYVAGGGTTIARVREVLTGKGMDRKAIKWEKFW